MRVAETKYITEEEFLALANLQEDKSAQTVSQLFNPNFLYLCVLDSGSWAVSFGWSISHTGHM